MRVYLSDSQIPELKYLPSVVRRVVVQRALAAMHADSRSFYWLPTALCVVGGLAGYLPGALLGAWLWKTSTAPFSGVNMTISMFSSYSGVAAGAVLLGSLGLIWQRSKLRRYLPEILSRLLPPKTW